MKEEGLLIEHIQGWKDINNQRIFQQWKNLGIGIGYGRWLAENCSRFRIEWEHVIASPSRHSHESRGHTLPVRSPTQKRSLLSRARDSIICSVEDDSTQGGSTTVDISSAEEGEDDLSSYRAGYGKGEDLDDSQCFVDSQE